MRVFRLSNIRELGVSNTTDYLVEVETRSGGPLVAYSTNVRVGTGDPSFQLAGAGAKARQYFVGVMSKAALHGSLWVSDLVLFNPSTQPLSADIGFIGTGLSGAEAPVRVGLQPGETKRIVDVLGAHWGLKSAQGVLTVDRVGATAPIAHVELYEDSDPDKRYGQAMQPQSTDEASGPSQKQALLGLAQDAAYRTVGWLFAPEGPTEVDLVYRDLTPQRNVIGALRGVKIKAGGVRAIVPSSHPVPADAGRFTVEVLVKSGKVLSGAQITNSVNNDPAFVRGQPAAQ
jgi:hypothetical protein